MSERDPDPRRIRDTPAETGPGIPDEALAVGEIGSVGLDDGAADHAVAALRRSRWAPRDVADAEAETEAHPS